MAPPLTASQRARALEFQVAGKSAKQLLEFLKLYDTDAAARLKAVTERYPLMVAVQDRLEELKAEATGGKAAAAEPEESTKSGRSKRTSTGYETGGKAKPASPRGPPPKKVAGYKRSAAAAAATSADDEASETGSSAAAREDEEDDEAEEETRPIKKIRTGKATAATTKRNATTKGAAAKKTATGRAGSRKSKQPAAAAAAAESEEESRRSESEASEDEGAAAMRDVKKPAAKGRPSTAAAASAAPSRRGSTTPYVDPSLLGPVGTVSPSPMRDTAAAAAAAGVVESQATTVLHGESEEEKEVSEDEDVEMREPSPSPPLPVSPSVPNPFQQPLTPQPAAAPSVRVSGQFTPSSVMVPTPFKQAKQVEDAKSLSEGGAAASLPPLRSSFGVSGFGVTGKFNTVLSAQPSASFSFSPHQSPPAAVAASARAAVSPAPSKPIAAAMHPAALSAVEIEEETEEEVYRPQPLPPYEPTFPSPQREHPAAVEPELRQRRPSDRYAASPFDSALPSETKYPLPSAAHYRSPSAGDNLERVGSRAKDRRYSDHVKGILLEEEQAETAGGEAGVEAPPRSFVGRVFGFLSPLARFLLRTLLIGLIVFTIATLAVDNPLKRALFTPSTVFCPSQGGPPRTPLPPGQLACHPCPEHGVCSVDGSLHCEPLYMRSGDDCVLNDRTHQRTEQLKEAIIDLLEVRAGEVVCDERPAAQRKLTADELRDELINAGHEQARLGGLWQLAVAALDKEVAPFDGDASVRPSARVGLHRDGTYEASQPRLSMQCKIQQVVTQWMPHIIAYLVFRVRRWWWRRQQVGPTCDRVRELLRRSVDYSGALAVPKPIAVAHLKEEYLEGQLGGSGDASSTNGLRKVRGDPVVWEKVAHRIDRDPRVERGKSTFGQTDRDSWSWTGQLEISPAY